VAGRDAAKLSTALLGVEKIFGRDLPANTTFTTAVTRALDSLFTRGSKATYTTFRSTDR
jgi:fructuronate reductase